MPLRRRIAVAAAAAGTIVAAGFAAAPAALAQPAPYLGNFSTVSTIASTIPKNGDVNPYGIAIVPESTGRLHAGNILIGNFNNAGNLQGTGTTLVQITPDGHRTLFATIDANNLPGPCPGGVGLTTALVVLPGGWVVVGSTPSADGTIATSGAGCLLVLDRNGRVRETFSGQGINGPWDSTAVTQNGVASLFVTNTLNGTAAANPSVVHEGTVLRLSLLLFGDQPPKLFAVTQIGSGFAEQGDPNAFVLGPTGVGLAADGTLYVADTQDSTIHAIPDALNGPGGTGTGQPVTSDNLLNAPLGLAIAPNGDILTVNGNDGNIVETTPAGDQIDSFTLDQSGGGTLFGLAVRPDLLGVYFVDDGTNTLNLLS